MKNALIENIVRLHTTELGVERVTDRRSGGMVPLEDTG